MWFPTLVGAIMIGTGVLGYLGVSARMREQIVKGLPPRSLFAAPLMGLALVLVWPASVLWGDGESPGAGAVVLVVVAVLAFVTFVVLSFWMPRRLYPTWYREWQQAAGLEREV